MNDADAPLWHPWLRINRVLRVMLHTRWSAEAWSQVRVEFKRALALRSGDPSAWGVQLRTFAKAMIQSVGNIKALIGAWTLPPGEVLMTRS